MPTWEEQAREHIDQALEQAGWRVQDYKSANFHAGRGVVIRNFPLVSGRVSRITCCMWMAKPQESLKRRKRGFP